MRGRARATKTLRNTVRLRRDCLPCTITKKHDIVSLSCALQPQGRRNRYGHYGLDRSTFRPKKKVRGGFESRHVHSTQVRTRTCQPSRFRRDCTEFDCYVPPSRFINPLSRFYRPSGFERDVPLPGVKSLAIPLYRVFVPLSIPFL